MLSVPPYDREAATSAEELQRAATTFRRGVRGPDAVRMLPTTLAQVDEVIEELATSAVVLAQAVDEYANVPDAGIDDEALPPEARALQWHLHELASRLRAAQNACPPARLWADGLLAKRPAARA